MIPTNGSFIRSFLQTPESIHSHLHIAVPEDMDVRKAGAHVYRYQSDLRVFVLKHNTQDVQVISKYDSEQTKLQQVHRYHAVLLINREWFCSHTDNTACSCNFSAFLKQRKGSDRLFIW